MEIINEKQIAKVIGYLPESVKNKHLLAAARAMTFWGIEFFYNDNYDIKYLDRYLFFHPALENYWLLLSCPGSAGNYFSSDGFLLYAIQSFAITSALNLGQDALYSTQTINKLKNLIKSVSKLHKQLFIGTFWYVFLIKLFESSNPIKNVKTRNKIITSTIKSTIEIIKNDVNVNLLKREIAWSDGNYQSSRCNYLHVASMNYSLSIVEQVLDAFVKFDFISKNEMIFSSPFTQFVESIFQQEMVFETNFESESYHKIAYRLSMDIFNNYPQLVANYSQDKLSDKDLFIAEYQRKKFLFRLKKIIF